MRVPDPSGVNLYPPRTACDAPRAFAWRSELAEAPLGPSVSRWLGLQSDQTDFNDSGAGLVIVPNHTEFTPTAKVESQLEYVSPAARDMEAAMSIGDNKRVVTNFIDTCQNQHNLAAADEIFHPEFVNRYMPGGVAIVSKSQGPASSFKTFYGMLLKAFPDASIEINEMIGERDLVATRKTLHGTHLGELWEFPPTGNKVEFEFIDIFRVKDGKLIEHWTHMDFDDLRRQVRPREVPR